MKLVFLDIDGVLNDYERSWREVPDYNPEFVPTCVQNFNRIIRETEARIVLSSSWRHLIHAGHMSLHGFQTLLRSHGVRGELIGWTRPDLCEEPRWKQIADWLRSPNHEGTAGESRSRLAGRKVERYCIIDDDHEAFGGRPGVQTAGGMGLTEADADAAIEILGRVEAIA
jgi:hypothetical protein